MMITKNNKTKEITIEDLENTLSYYSRSEIVNNSAGKIISRRLENFKDGDIVKIVKARPKNKKWIKNKSRHWPKYYRIVASNGTYGILASANDSEVKKEDEEKLAIITKGYKPSDVFDLNLFISEYFPDMIDKYIEKYTQIVSEESPHYKDNLKVLQNLKENLEENKTFMLSDDQFDEEKRIALQKKTKKAFGKFGEYLHSFWI